MEIYQGIEGFGSVAMGPIKVLKKKHSFHTSFDENEELQKFEKAKEKVIEILRKEHSDALNNIESKLQNNENYESELMLLSDHQLYDAIIGRILNQHHKASTAISGAGKYFEDVLSKMKDDYLHSKSTDMKCLTRRLLSCLEGYDGADVYLPESCIIAAHSLTPVEFLQIDKSKLLGLLVEESSINSHMAILAKTLGIPTIIGCEISDDWDGRSAILDAGWRVIYLNPDEQTIADMKERMEEESKKAKKLKELKGRQCITKDGLSIHLYGNISSSEEVLTANEYDAEGIGLFRSEVLYMNRNEAPSESELFEEYKKLVMGMNGKPVTIRTVDIGMDKHLPYIEKPEENNSALGLRGIRLCLRLPDLFKTQLKAILRASAFGNVSIMYPMISSIREILQAQELLEECRRELSAAGILYKDVRQGVMIETPAAVMISDEIAKHVSFISIGTNDLTQYTLGVDRENKELSDICDYHHPAILKMIQMAVKNGHKMHIPVGICGELASDETLTSLFLELGVDNLSVAPAQILSLRNSIIEMDLKSGTKRDL